MIQKGNSLPLNVHNTEGRFYCRPVTCLNHAPHEQNFTPAAHLELKALSQTQARPCQAQAAAVQVCEALTGVVAGGSGGGKARHMSSTGSSSACVSGAHWSHGWWGWGGRRPKAGQHGLVGSPAGAAPAPQARQTPACATWHQPATAGLVGRGPAGAGGLLGGPAPLQ